MFEQDVAGEHPPRARLIKALRANKNDEQSVIQRALDETRKEIKSSDVEVKAAAVLKLVYLEMLGHSISFAAFAIVECMTSTKYHIKSIGYLAASQCFDRETEVAVLVVNLVKKDLLQPPTPLFSTSPSSITVAHLSSTLSAVSLLLTPSLARDLAPELLSLLTHSRPIVRKQTVLVLFRINRTWPGVKEVASGREEHGEDPWIERLRERLSDEDVGVVSATVNLICELARKDPRKYLPLAPELFELLTDSTNNWMLIKIIKLVRPRHLGCVARQLPAHLPHRSCFLQFAVLTPEEPRLVKKLVPPLTELIETTPAMSLLFECIQTSIVGGMLNGREGEALATTCVEKLKSFLEDIDQNLRYIALVALVKILPTHPHLVATHHDTILSCVDDPDISIRMRALDLVEGMVRPSLSARSLGFSETRSGTDILGQSSLLSTQVDRRTLQSIVHRLMTHLRPPSSSSQTSAADALLRAQSGGASLDGATPAATALILSPAYRSSLISLILRMCASQTYGNIVNFPWYIDTLIELAYISLTIIDESSPVSTTAGSALGIPLGLQIRDSLIDLTARAKAIRPYAVKKMAQLIGDDILLECGNENGVGEVLGAAAELDDPRPVIASLFGSSTTSSMPPRIIALYFHNGVKIFAHYLHSLASSWNESDAATLEQIRALSTALEEQMRTFAGHEEMELQEQAASLGQTLSWVRAGLDHRLPVSNQVGGFGSSSLDPYDPITDDAVGAGPLAKPEPASLRWLEPLFFAHELNPVNPKAQGMVAVPEGLDLGKRIVMRDSSVSGIRDEEASGQVDAFGRRLQGSGSDEALEKGKAKKSRTKGTKEGKTRRRKASQAVEENDDPEEMARLRSERLERQRDDPYYVGSTPAGGAGDSDDVDAIPIVRLDLGTLTSQPRTPPPPREPTPPPVHIDVHGEMPAIAPARLQTPSLGKAPGKTDDEPSTAAEAPPPETQEAEEAQASAVVTKVVKKKKTTPNSSLLVGAATEKKKKKKVKKDSLTTPAEP
ncbi:BZ3500_MvSof-1268-A1-R1_Chr3-1g05630 [Microbotryum saponariae]|uniref:AP-3 complex subunit delta n=1 Tax=Microbotryum saponariae TaxID=289078 RepID=A0A2X0LIJ6_9BASI|nr:BZ3500_MvSof-1268-A1-R1_Chr3-1g05630 [Microbotryum saponariae]SDA04820.1 BZ3501_MvSof-1269-A2-R1_Chr3-1g05300 [Microbotryum saponariae]